MEFLFDVLQHLEALGDLDLAQLAEGHLLDIDVVSLERGVEHVVVEDQLNELLRSLVQLAWCSFLASCICCR